MAATAERFDVKDLDEAHESYLNWLDVLKVRKYIGLGMAHRKFKRGDRIVTTVMIPPSYRLACGEESHTLQAALPEDNRRQPVAVN